jgi:hypothetical protein
MNTETRTIRPFTGLGGLDEVLEGVVLHFGPDAVRANESIALDMPPYEFLLRPVHLEWAADEVSFHEFKDLLVTRALRAEIPLDSLSLVVVASSSFLKIAEIVFTWPVDDIDALPRQTALTEVRRPRAFNTPFSGFRVDVYLLLDRDLAFRPLRPHRRGTWIARSNYRIETTLGPAVLPPTPLTDEIRTRYGLPAKTIRYFDFGDHDVTQPYAEQEPPVFYIDANLLGQLNARRNSPASRAIQLQLAIDFIHAVIRRASASNDLDGLKYDDLRATLLGNVLRVAAGPGASHADLDNLVRKVQDDPEYVVARAEHFADVQSGFVGCLEEAES